MEQRKSATGSQSLLQQRGGNQSQKEPQIAGQKNITTGTGVRFPLVDYDSDSDDPSSPQDAQLNTEESGSSNSNVRVAGENKTSVAGSAKVNTGTSAQAKVPEGGGGVTASVSQGSKNLSGSKNEPSRTTGKETTGGQNAPVQKKASAVMSKSEPTSQKVPTSTSVNIVTTQASSKVVAVTSASKTPQSSASKIHANTTSISSSAGSTTVSTKVVSSLSSVSTAHIPPKSASTPTKSTPSTTVKIVSGSSKLISPAPSRPGAVSTTRPGAPGSVRPGVPTPARPGAPTSVRSGTPTLKPGTPTPPRPGTPSPTRPAVSSSTGPGTPPLTRAGTPSPARPGAPLPVRSGTPTSARPGTPASTKSGVTTPTKPGAPPSARLGTPTSTRPGAPPATRSGTGAPTRPSAPVPTRPGAPTATRLGVPTAARPSTQVTTGAGPLTTTRSGALVKPGTPAKPGTSSIQLGTSETTKSEGSTKLVAAPGTPTSATAPSKPVAAASVNTAAPVKPGDIPLPSKPAVTQPSKSASSTPVKPALVTGKPSAGPAKIVVTPTKSGVSGKTAALPTAKPTTTTVSLSKSGAVPLSPSEPADTALSSESSIASKSKPVVAASSPCPSVPASKSAAEINLKSGALQKLRTAQPSKAISASTASASISGVVAPSLPSKLKAVPPAPSKRGVAAPPSTESGVSDSEVSALHSKLGTPAAQLTAKTHAEGSSDGKQAQGEVSLDTKTSTHSVTPRSFQNISAVVDEVSGTAADKSIGVPTNLTSTLQTTDVSGKGTTSGQPAKIPKEKLSQNPCTSSVTVDKTSNQSDLSSMSGAELSSETSSHLEASIEAELARLDGGEDYKTDQGLSHLVAGQPDTKIKTSSNASQPGYLKQKEPPHQGNATKGIVVSTSKVKDMTSKTDTSSSDKTNMVKAAFADMRAMEKKELEESAEAHKSFLKNEESLNRKKDECSNSDADETDNMTAGEEKSLIKCKSLPTDMTAIREFMEQKEAMKDGSVLKEGSDDNEDEPAIKKARMEIQANMASAAPSYCSAFSSNISSAMSSACVTTDNTPENSNLTSASDETRDTKDLDKMIYAEESKEEEDSKKDGMDDDGGEDEKDKNDDLSQATPRRKRKRRYYERPRGEGGKFMKSSEPVVMDEDTRMDANTSSVSMTRPILPDEDSRGSTGNSSSKREVRRFRCEVVVPRSTETFTADRLYEYTWPLEGIGEHYFIQEHISAFLGIMSFKRRYPDLRRRAIDMHERDYLREKQVVSEMDCDLGLTAVRSEDVLDVLYNDFPNKFEELQRILRERSENQLKERGKVAYQMANIDKSKLQEHVRKAASAAARWNANLNKERKEERRYSFDLQSFTLQKPIGRGKKLPPEYTKMGHYPVSVLPGQYTDFYKTYTPNEMKYLPLCTVLYGPRTKDQLGSDGAPSDSEDENGDITTTKVEKVDMDSDEGSPHCKVCNGTRKRNKESKPEPLIICAQCSSASHPTCIDLTLNMVTKIQGYDWQCMDCKTCVQCNDPDDEEKMIFCDMCDRGYHIYCVGLRRVPQGRWHCKVCAVCSSCGSKNPAGSENIKNADWQHEFKKDKDNRQLVYAATLCMPCDKYWKRRQFCNICLRVYRSIPEDGMVRCSSCPKYIHKEGCSVIHENERFCNNCFRMRNNTAMNHSRIIAAAKKKMASGY